MKKTLARGAVVAFLSAAALVPLAGAAQAAAPQSAATTVSARGHDECGCNDWWRNFDNNNWWRNRGRDRDCDRFGDREGGRNGDNGRGGDNGRNGDNGRGGDNGRNGDGGGNGDNGRGGNRDRDCCFRFGDREGDRGRFSNREFNGINMGLGGGILGIL